MKKLNLVMLMVIISCSATPKKPFKTLPFLPYDNACFERLLENNVIETVCMSDNDTFIAMPLKDFQNELNWQDELISKCKKWKR